MNTDEIEYLSPEKFKELEKELDHLKTARRKEIADALEYARSLGDLSENAEYQEAREIQGRVESRIAALEDLLKRAKIIKSHHSTTVEMGSTVVIKKKGDKEGRKFRVVGSSEADLALGRISNESPIGQAMMGKQKGETFDVITPKGSTLYEVSDIE